jgi:hypothetical protein
LFGHNQRTCPKQDACGTSEGSDPATGTSEGAHSRHTSEGAQFPGFPTRSSHHALAVQSIIVNECVHFRAATQGIAPPTVDSTTHAVMINAIVDPTTGQLLEFRRLIADPKTRPTWMTAAANEFGQLMDGLLRGIKGTNTMSFIHKTQVPKDCMVTYARFCCDYRPQKSEPYRCRITVGGDQTNYVGEVSTKTADLTTIKCLLNSVVSRPRGKFMTTDAKNFYLNTPMDRPEYMRIALKNIPDEIIQEYKVMDLVHDRYVYCKIVKGMYGLPQAGRLANQLLEKRLKPYGYSPAPHTHGLWRHNN